LSNAVASVTTWDGNVFTVEHPEPLPSGIHRGSLFFQGTFVAGGRWLQPE
jgi:hypothetical protein